jgi:hypothetical protein
VIFHNIGKVYSLEHTEIPKVFFTEHDGRRHQQSKNRVTNATMVSMETMVSKVIVAV